MKLTEIIKKTAVPLFPGSVALKAHDSIWTFVESKELERELEKDKEKSLLSRLFTLPGKITTSITGGALEYFSLMSGIEAYQLASTGKPLQATGLALGNLLIRYLTFHGFDKLDKTAEQKIEELEIKHYGKVLPHQSVIKDLKRLLNWGDYAYAFGDFLYRKSMRYTMLTAGVVGAGYAANYIPGIKDVLPNISAKQAIFWPLVVGGGSMVGGLTFKFLPKVFYQGRLIAAQGNFLNLMEDYRKAEEDEHLEKLWERVFKYESRLKFTDEERKEETEYIKKQVEEIKKLLTEGLSCENLKFLRPDDKNIDALVTDLLDNQPLTSNVERTREGFLISAKYALEHHIPQKEKKLQTGFGLGLLEDWRDGAYFSIDDTKLAEQAKGNLTLKMLAKDVFGALKTAEQIMKRLYQKIWFHLATRSVSSNVGKAVNEFGKKYRDNFNAQVFLWPGHEDSEWMKQFGPEGREELLAERKRIIGNAFGHTWEFASKMIERMTLPDFEWASEVRSRYDAEYIDGTFEYNLIDDLEMMNYDRSYIFNASKRMRRARENLDKFATYLKSQRPELFEFENAEALRAVKTAYHHNRDDIQSKFKNKIFSKSLRDEEGVNEVIEKAMAEKEKYTRKLLKLRLHHQLTIFEVEGYKRIVKELAF